MKTRLKNFFFSSVCLIAISCGGGGGGGTEEQPKPDQNACDIFGLGFRIISGTQCTPGRSPLAKIQVQSSNSTALCTGTLISPTKILSAAHCVYKEDFSGLENPSHFRVFFDSGESVAVSAVRAHPSFVSDFNRIIQTAQSDGVDPNSSAFDSKFGEYIKSLGLADVSVMTLASPVTITPAPVHTSESPALGLILSIFGYGLTNQSTGATPSSVVSGEMAILDSGIKNLFARFEAGSSDTCSGDSGGPAFIEEDDGTHSIAGTTLGGGAKCVPGDISVFTMMSGADIGTFIQTNAPDGVYY